MPDLSKVLTAKELSAYLKVHVSTIYKHLKLGKLPGFKVGDDWRFTMEAIDRWQLEQEKASQAGHHRTANGRSTEASRTKAP
jgi:excisionase family DNA binding protein